MVLKITKGLVSACFTIVLIAMPLCFIGQTAIGQVAPADAACAEHPDTAYCKSLNDPNADPNASGGMISKVTNIITYIAGFIGVFWIIIQAIKMATSQGDATKVKDARNGIIYAVVGLAVVLVARVVINFALNRL